MGPLDWTLVVVDGLLLVPVVVLAAEILLASPAAIRKAAVAGVRGRIAILIPAHDEASGIVETIGSIQPQLLACDRLLVVADNCSDDTAALAVGAGAQAIERRDTERRGKGFALDFGIRHLAEDPPDLLVIVDADCRMASGCVEQLVLACHAAKRPIQALYLMRAPRDAAITTRIAELAWCVKNLVRPLGLHRVGLPCQLMGSGMAFPWDVIRSARLATGHIVEDLKLGVDLAVAGFAPLFCPQALVTSEFPESTTGLVAQRSRWEHGHLSVILEDAPRVLGAALRHCSLPLLALALDLLVPPLALLGVMLALAWVAGLCLFLAARVTLPLALATLAIALLSGALALAWQRFGREIVPVRLLPSAARYVLDKIPLYVRFVTARQTTWIRSKRSRE